MSGRHRRMQVRRTAAWLLTIAVVASGCSSSAKQATSTTVAVEDTAASTSPSGSSSGSSGTSPTGTAATDTAASDTGSATSDAPDDTATQKAPDTAPDGSATTTGPSSTSTSVATTSSTSGATTPTDAPTSSTATVTSTATTDAAPGTSLDDTPTTPCAFTPALPTGEVTWVADGQLRALAEGSPPTCLLDGVDDSTPRTSWSSDASRVLLGSSTSANPSGSAQTGFGDANATVRLSAPTGSATIAVDPTTHRLMHRTANGALTDISFLATTDEAIYHPGGKRIIAVGTDADGAYGIWLSTNTGKDPKQILSVVDPTTPVTNLNLSPDGHTLYFVHGFVHMLFLDALVLDVIGTPDTQEDHLTVSTLENAQAFTRGPCDATGTLMMTSTITNGLQDIRTMAGSPLIGTSDTVQPVGWLYGYKLVFATRASGCTGPADLWVWSPVNGFTQIAHNASAASVRLPRGPYSDLPDDIEQAAPG